jgi:hypothetical protein
LLIEVTGQIMPTLTPAGDPVPVAIPVAATSTSPTLKKSGVKASVKSVKVKVAQIKKSKVVKKKDKASPERKASE